MRHLIMHLCSLFSQAEIQYLLSGNRYDGKEDFAVVLQPFLQNYFIPQIGVSCRHRHISIQSS